VVLRAGFDQRVISWRPVLPLHDALLGDITDCERAASRRRL